MITAIELKTNEIKLASDANKDSSFICKFCKEKVILRKGYHRIHHFSHEKDSNCLYAGESELHMTIKTQIFSHINNSLNQKLKILEMEYVLPNSIPDIYFEGTKSKVAIEVQCSALTSEEIITRTKKYYDIGIHVLWILPFQYKRVFKFIPNKNGSIQKEFERYFRLKDMELTFLHSYDLNLFFWDDEQVWSDGFIVVKFDRIYDGPKGKKFWSKYPLDYPEAFDEEGKEVYGDYKVASYMKQTYHIREIEINKKITDFVPLSFKQKRIPLTNIYLPDFLGLKLR